jgi:hypothetical protein
MSTPTTLPVAQASCSIDRRERESGGEEGESGRERGAMQGASARERESDEGEPVRWWWSGARERKEGQRKEGQRHASQ